MTFFITEELSPSQIGGTLWHPTSPAGMPEAKLACPSRAMSSDLVGDGGSGGSCTAGTDPSNAGRSGRSSSCSAGLNGPSPPAPDAASAPRPRHPLTQRFRVDAQLPRHSRHAPPAGLHQRDRVPLELPRVPRSTHEDILSTDP